MSSTERSPERTWPPKWVLARDVLSFLFGWGLIFWEVSRPEIRETVLALGGAAAGFPGLALGARSILDAMAGRRPPGIDGPSSEPQPEAARP